MSLIMFNMSYIYSSKTAEDLGTALFVHPWDMQMGGRQSKYWLPWLVGKLASNKIMVLCVKERYFIKVKVRFAFM